MVASTVAHSPHSAPAESKEIYLDCAATTPVDPAVTAAMRETESVLAANPASIHSSGIRAASAVEMARMRIAERIGAVPEALFFTASATESNNLAIKGTVWNHSAHDKHVVISAIEHPSVHEVTTWLEQTGQARVTLVPVDDQGRISPDEVAAAITPQTVLVSIMHANNEVGTIQPIAEIAQICSDRGVLSHSDACQSFLKVPIDAQAWGLDLLTINAHKAHGPKGVAALYVRPGTLLTPLLHGGGQEMGMRSSTVNVAAIVGFSETVAQYSADDVTHIGSLKQALIVRLQAAFPEIRINGHLSSSLVSVLNVAIDGFDGADLAKALDRRGIRVSASSACHATRLEPSHVLKAMGQSDAQADAALRISLGRFNDASQVDRLMDALVGIVNGAEQGIKASAGAS